MTRRSFLLTIASIFTLSFSNLCLAKIIYYGSQTESISLSAGQSTILRFNEEVKTISQISQFKIGPADEKDPSFNLLSITPRSRSSKSKVTLILVNDVVISLNLNTVSSSSPEKTNNFYDFRPKENNAEAISKNSKGSNVSELELMNAMIRSDDVVGYKSRSLIRTVNSGQKDIKAQLVKIYTGPKFNGYVFKIVNNSSKNLFAIDLKSLTLGRPNVALLSQSDKSILKPRDKKNKEQNATFLRIVAKPSSIYRSITLPIAPIQKK